MCCNIITAVSAAAAAAAAVFGYNWTNFSEILKVKKATSPEVKLLE